MSCSQMSEDYILQENRFGPGGQAEHNVTMGDGVDPFDVEFNYEAL